MLFRSCSSETTSAWHDNGVKAGPHRILMVLPNDGTGGMQSQARLLARSLQEQGHRVVLAVGGGATLDAVVPQMPLPRFRTATVVWFYLRLLVLAIQTRASVVHAHGLRLGPVVAFLPVRRRIVTCHGVDPAHIPTALMWLLAHCPVDVVSCGEMPRRELARHGVTSSVINNAVDNAPTSRSRAEFDAHFGTSPHDFVALWPARFSRQKGHDLLIEAFRDLKGSNIKVICCGDGPLRESIAREIHQKGLGDNLIIRDFEPHAAVWLAPTDFLVVPSRWEGQPLVVLEATRAGLPTVSLIPLEHAVAHVPTVHHLADMLRVWSARGHDYDIARQITASMPLKNHDVSIITQNYLDLYDLP